MAEEKQSGAREVARQVLESRLTEAQLDALFDGALAIEKQARGWCPKCKSAVMVTVADGKAVVSAVSEIVTKIAALPKGEDEVDRIVFERVVYMSPDPDADAPV